MLNLFVGTCVCNQQIQMHIHNWLYCRCPEVPNTFVRRDMLIHNLMQLTVWTGQFSLIAQVGDYKFDVAAHVYRWKLIPSRCQGKALLMELMHVSDPSSSTSNVFFLYYLSTCGIWILMMGSCSSKDQKLRD